MERDEFPGTLRSHFSSDGRLLCPELNEVLLALQRQTQLGAVLLTLFGPGVRSYCGRQLNAPFRK